MRTAVKRVLPVAIIFMSFGCSGSEPQPVSQMHQVLGALQIPGKADRDSALAAACRECAEHGDIESVLLGLPKISDRKLRDEVTKQCVQKFVDAARESDAKKISDLPAG